MKPITIAALLLLTLAPAASAQELPARLTLEDALRIAEANNPIYRQTLNDGDVAEAQRRRSWGAFLPRVSADLSLGGSSSRTITGEDNFGQPITRPDPLEFKGSSSSQGISASATLFDGLRSIHQLRAAGAGGEAADARRAGQAVALRANVLRRFFAALEKQLLIALEERLLASYQERLETTEIRLRVAATDPVDVLGARIDVATQEQKVERARGDAEIARLDLLRDALGIDIPPSFEPIGEPPEPFDPAALDADALVGAALAAHPLILERTAQSAAAGYRVAAARSDRWPTVSLSAGYSRSISLSSYDALTELNPRNTAFRFGLSASLPIFSQFATAASVAQASADREDADEALRAARLTTDREVRAALIELRNAFRAVQLAERSAELSRQRLELAQEKYRMGALSFTDLQTLTDRAAEAERQAIQARFGFAASLATLEEKVGKEVGP